MYGTDNGSNVMIINLLIKYMHFSSILVTFIISPILYEKLIQNSGLYGFKNFEIQ